MILSPLHTAQIDKWSDTNNRDMEKPIASLCILPRRTAFPVGSICAIFMPRQFRREIVFKGSFLVNLPNKVLFSVQILDSFWLEKKLRRETLSNVWVRSAIWSESSK
jgi:hypothetical protein